MPKARGSSPNHLVGATWNSFHIWPRGWWNYHSGPHAHNPSVLNKQTSSTYSHCCIWMISFWWVVSTTERLAIGLLWHSCWNIYRRNCSMLRDYQWWRIAWQVTIAACSHMARSTLQPSETSHRFLKDLYRFTWQWLLVSCCCALVS